MEIAKGDEREEEDNKKGKVPVPSLKYTNTMITTTTTVIAT